MNNFNFSVIEGTLITDPVQTEQGCAYKIESVNDKGNTTFLIQVTDKLADNCLKFIKQGSRVLVSGILKNDYILGKEINFLKTGA